MVVDTMSGVGGGVNVSCVGGIGDGRSEVSRTADGAVKEVDRGTLSNDRSTSSLNLAHSSVEAALPPSSLTNTSTVSSTRESGIGAADWLGGYGGYGMNISSEIINGRGCPSGGGEDRGSGGVGGIGVGGIGEGRIGGSNFSRAFIMPSSDSVPQSLNHAAMGATVASDSSTAASETGFGIMERHQR